MDSLLSLPGEWGGAVCVGAASTTGGATTISTTSTRQPTGSNSCRLVGSDSRLSRGFLVGGHPRQHTHRQGLGLGKVGSGSGWCNLGLGSHTAGSFRPTNSPSLSLCPTSTFHHTNTPRQHCSPASTAGNTGQRCRNFAASDASPSSFCQQAQPKPLESARRRPAREASQDYSNQEAGRALHQGAGKGFG